MVLRKRTTTTKPPRHTTTTTTRKPRRTTTTLVATTTLAPATTTTTRPPAIGVPTGPIQTRMPGGGVFPVPWDTITRWDHQIHTAADPLGWSTERVRATIAIESQGDPNAIQKNMSNGWSYGLMQIVPYGVGWNGWHEFVKEVAGLPANASRKQVIDALYDPAINIAVGVAILEYAWNTYGTADAASSYFFTGTPDWFGSDSVNGTTGAQYKRALNDLIAEQRGVTPVTTTTPAPTQGDPLAVVVGTSEYTVISAFGEWSDNGLYGYAIGHGALFDQCGGNCHTGIDIATNLGQTLYAVKPGVVTCAGTGVGGGSWSTGCAAFNDYMGSGAGRVEVLQDDGVAVIYGHSSRSLVRAGDRVVAGTPVALAGGMYSLHVHLECRVWIDGDYEIVDPVIALGGDLPIVYAPRLDVPQPATLDTFAEYEVVADETRVLQYADASAPDVDAPLKRGNRVYAAHHLYGDDKRWYAVGRHRGRVALDDLRPVV